MLSMRTLANVKIERRHIGQRRPHSFAARARHVRQNQCEQGVITGSSASQRHTGHSTACAGAAGCPGASAVAVSSRAVEARPRDAGASARPAPRARPRPRPRPAAPLRAPARSSRCRCARPADSATLPLAKCAGRSSFRPIRQRNFALRRWPSCEASSSADDLSRSCGGCDASAAAPRCTRRSRGLAADAVAAPAAAAAVSLLGRWRRSGSSGRTPDSVPPSSNDSVISPLSGSMASTFPGQSRRLPSASSSKAMLTRHPTVQPPRGRRAREA